MSRIAFIGLGAMGSRMATRLLQAGHQVTVTNRTLTAAEPLSQLGASIASSPAEAARDADVVIAMVRDDEASRSIWTNSDHGALSTMNRSAIAVDMSTLTPEWTRELNVACHAVGISFVEAPVVGTRPHAENGALTVLAAGGQEVVEGLESIFSAFSSTTHFMGDVGSAAVTKLAVNSMFAIQVAALSDVLGMMGRSGISLEKSADVLSSMATASPAANFIAGRITAGVRDPNFPVELVAKDLDYAAKTVERQGGSNDQIQAALRAFEAALDSGFGGEDIGSVSRMNLDGLRS